MKTVCTILIFALTLHLVPSMAHAPSDEAVKVLSVRRYVFYFKVEKRLVGGTVQIYDECGELVATEPIEQIKNIIDFFYIAPGTYTIRVIKEKEVFLFTYANKE